MAATAAIRARATTYLRRMSRIRPVNGFFKRTTSLLTSYAGVYWAMLL